MSTNEPLVRVENFSDPDVAGAVADLTDSSDATGIRISSADEASWFLHLDAPDLAASTSFTLTMRFNVISRSPTEGFVIRWTLRDEPWTASTEEDVPVSDGLSTYTVTVDEAWVASHPFTFVTGEPDTYAGLVAALGAAPLVALEPRAGNPYEVDLLEVSLTVETGEEPAAPELVTRLWPRKDALGAMGSAPRLLGNIPAERIYPAQQ